MSQLFKKTGDVYDKLLSRSEIGEMILCYKPFLLTGEAWVFGSSLDNLDKIVAFSIDLLQNNFYSQNFIS